MKCKPDVKGNMWGPKEWSLDAINEAPESFKGHLELERAI